MKEVKTAPLPASFMVGSMLGIVVVGFGVVPYTDTYPGLLPWVTVFLLVFIIGFIASVISMTKAEPLPHHMEELSIHEESETDE